MRCVRIAALLALAPACVAARPESPAPSGARWALGPEVQVYPAGVVVALRAERPVAQRGTLHGRLGWNFTDRRDFGEHDDEEGDGPGLGIGYRHRLSEDPAGWLLGARLDAWALEIDWEDDPSGGMPRRRGTTDVLVLQPTLEGGRSWWIGRALLLEATLGLGVEINVDTDGEDVGEGAILLGGVALRRVAGS